MEHVDPVADLATTEECEEKVGSEPPESIISVPRTSEVPYSETPGDSLTSRTGRYE